MIPVTVKVRSFDENNSVRKEKDFRSTSSCSRSGPRT